MWRRVWNQVVDLIDGGLASALFGHLGGSTAYSRLAEAENAEKLRQWAASPGSPASEPEPSGPRLEQPEDFDARMRRFRAETARSSED